MRRSYPVTLVPAEHEAKRPSFNEGLSTGRHHDTHLPREWFLSNAAYEAYVAGFEEGKRQRKHSEEDAPFAEMWYS
jgi:hypothetical protein